MLRTENLSPIDEDDEDDDDSNEDDAYDTAPDDIPAKSHHHPTRSIDRRLQTIERNHEQTVETVFNLTRTFAIVCQTKLSTIHSLESRLSAVEVQLKEFALAIDALQRAYSVS